MALLLTTLKGTRILCVDDSLDSLELLRTIFVRQGAHVVTCSSAEEAILILGKERFDVMVSDLSMPPGLDGYDLAHALRKMESQDPERQSTPTVAVSGDALAPSRKRRYADFQVYMPKPVNSARLVCIAERLLEADGEAVKLGSLGSWEAEQKMKAAVIATNVAANATAGAAKETVRAVDMTETAAIALSSATNAKVRTAEIERKANKGSISQNV